MGLFITAAYGSSKDVSVYSSAGVNPSRIFSITGGKRGCTNIDSYASHLNDLNEGLYDLQNHLIHRLSSLPPIH